MPCLLDTDRLCGNQTIRRLKLRVYRGGAVKYLSRVLVVLSLGCVQVWAQSTAQISGNVSDGTGAVLPGVEITATQTDTGIARSGISNETGSGSWQRLWRRIAHKLFESSGICATGHGPDREYRLSKKREPRYGFDVFNLWPDQHCKRSENPPVCIEVCFLVP